MLQLKLFRLFVPLLLVLLTVSSCQQAKRQEIRASHADSVIFMAGAHLHYDRMLELADSFEAEGDISKLNANRWRGVAYYRQGQYHLSEIFYRKALESEVTTSAEQLSYNKVARRLSELLLIKGDFEGSLRMAIPAVAKMDKSGIGSDIDYAILLNNIGICQLHLGRVKEAEESFITARGHYANRWQSDTTSRGFQEAVIGTVYTSQAYINTRHYAESIYWIDRTEMLLNMYRQRKDARKEYFDEYQGRIEIMRAIALEGLKKSKEAAAAYRRFQQTAYSQTAAGHINGNDYLMVAKRYKEAAFNYRFLDKALADWDSELTLDNIQLYMLPKYRANAEAHRGDSARVIGQRILALLDSAITTHKSSSTAELATIYDTQGKEAEIARKEADLSKTRLFSTGIALVLIIIFFLVYTLVKRKAAQRLSVAHEKLEDAHERLEEAHSQLQTAYDQLEKTTKAKERIESELRIARDIQHSMVPSTFPEREGLDLFASMTPAKEVGGDLYGYLLQGDEIYFCVGDVSGKGVPASLFMAQATRLFRTLAAQHMQPAEICTRMNDALVEDNEQGMFVTMFLGKVDLLTGHLDFCNAGHNPPIWKYPPEYLEVESNAPIGLWPGLTFEGQQIDSIKGHPMLVYTDGLNEAENEQQEQYGDDRLLNYISSSSFTCCRDVIESLKTQVEQHRDGAEPNDDLTLLCILVK